MLLETTRMDSCKEALIHISKGTDSQQLVSHLQHLLTCEGGTILERSFPVDLSLKIKQALEDSKIDHFIKIVFAYSINSGHTYGDIMIRSMSIPRTDPVRLQLAAIAKFEDQEKAVDAMINLLIREGGDITLDKFPADEFYALNAVIQHSPAAREIATGFAFTIKDELQPYGTAYFAFDHTSSTPTKYRRKG